MSSKSTTADEGLEAHLGFMSRTLDVMYKEGPRYIAPPAPKFRPTEIVSYYTYAEIDIYISYLTPQDIVMIVEYIRSKWADGVPALITELMEEDLDNAFFLDDSDDMFAIFVVVLCLYAKDKGGTYKDVLKILNKGKYMCIPDISIHENKIHIGTVYKLFGMGRHMDAKKMDCPRVWDLYIDEVVDNPNIYEGSYMIAAITHRWEPNEVTYKDLMRIRQTNDILEELGMLPKTTKISTMSKKLAKIREELKDQIRYVWMDSVCIDKTSSVELDMSIRSMYRWYKNASFVYLEGETNFKEWCARGWTLQEGHAARNLLVSPKHGNSFMELMSRLDSFDTRDLALCKVPEQSSSAYWFNLMENRKTTIIEDKAYALIGIFGLDFQIAYGEGKRAMERLQEEVARQKERLKLV